MQTVKVGDDVECGLMDNPCNGPLASGRKYRVRYTLFSGNQSTDYDFFPGATFSTSTSKKDQ